MRTAVAVVFYHLLAILYTLPLALEISTAIPHDLGDPLLTTWLVWWNAHALPLTPAWWSPPAFYPASGVIALSDPRIGLSLLTSPLQWAGASAVTAANVALIVSFAWAATAAHLLVRQLTGRHDAALLAGLLFGFNPYRAAHLEHLELLWSMWMPVSLLFAHRWATRHAPKDLALFAAAFLLQALSSLYYAVYFSVLLTGWFLWFLRRPWRRRDWAGVAVAGGVVFACLTPLALGFLQVHKTYGLVRSIDDIQRFSADIAGLISGSSLLRFGPGVIEGLEQEGLIYPGVVGPVLLLVPLFLWRATTSTLGIRRSSLTVASLAIAGVAGAVALFVMTSGRFSLRQYGIPISARDVDKPFSVALLMLAVAALSSRRFRALWHAQSPFAFYAVATVVAWLLALGPEGRLAGLPLIYKAPYSWLMEIPFFGTAIRVPARFAMIAVLTMSVASGLAWSRCTAQWTTRSRWIAAAALAIVALATSWLGSFPTRPVPGELALPPELERAVAILELPHDGVERDFIAQFRTTQHQRPTVNGASGYAPPHYNALQAALQVQDYRALDAIATRGPLGIVIDRTSPTAEGTSKGLLAAGARLVHESTTFRYLLWERSAPGSDGEPHGAVRVNIASVQVRGLEPGSTREGRFGWMWASTGPQRGSESLVLTLERPRTVSRLELMLGAYPEGAPRQLVIEASADGRQWRELFDGATGRAAVAGALADPLRVPLVFSFEPTLAAYLRLRQTGADPNRGWVVNDVRVLAVPRPEGDTRREQRHRDTRRAGHQSRQSMALRGDRVY